MHVPSHRAALAVAALLATSDLQAPTPPPSSARSPSVGPDEPGLILTVDQGERRVRRLLGWGAVHPQGGPPQRRLVRSRHGVRSPATGGCHSAAPASTRR